MDVIEAGFPAASIGDFEAVEAVAKAIKTSRVCGLARALDKDIDRAGEALKAAERSRIHTFIATSPIHMQQKLHMQPEQVIEHAVRAVKRARQFTDDVEFSPEDAGRSEEDFLCRILEAVMMRRTDTKYPWYRRLQHSTTIWRDHCQFNPTYSQFWQSYFFCALSQWLRFGDSLAAVMNGARQLECTINGLGERAGNASLEEVVMAIKTRRDVFSCHTGLVLAKSWRAPAWYHPSLDFQYNRTKQ